MAVAALEAGKPTVRIESEVVDSPLAVYGRDFYYGDRVSVSAFGFSFNCFITSVRNRVSSRGERLTISLSGVIVNDPDSSNTLETWSLRNYVHSTSVGGYMEIAPPP